MNEYYKPLKNLPEITNWETLQKYRGLDYTQFQMSDVNPELIEVFDKIGLRLKFVQLFYRKPTDHKVYRIHTDWPVYGDDFAKINWVYGGQGSSMSWFTQKPTVNKEADKSWPHGNGLLFYNEDEVDFVYSTELSSPSIVQVGIPHSVANPYEDRYCISVVPSLKDGPDYHISVPVATKMLNDYLLAPPDGIEPSFHWQFPPYDQSCGPLRTSPLYYGGKK